jgi:hypothetical protein
MYDIGPQGQSILYAKAIGISPARSPRVNRICCIKAVRYDVRDDMNYRKLNEDVESGGSPSAQCLHYPLDAILTCVRWYLAFPLILRHLEEMTDNFVEQDHRAVKRCTRLMPEFKIFRCARILFSRH